MIGICVLFLSMIVLIGVTEFPKLGIGYSNGALPQDSLLIISNTGTLDTDQIRGTYLPTSSYECKDTNHAAKLVNLRYEQIGPLCDGSCSPLFRDALVCGNTYWILDSNSSGVIEIYGPFQKYN